MMQLSMFDIFEPPPPPPVYVEPVRRKVMGLAYGGTHEFTLSEGQPDPFQIEVRGIACTITPGFCTYVIDGPGSLFWSETGFRSFGYGYDIHDADEICAAIERYIKAPAKDGNGCGGKLVRWWPGYIREWQGKVAWSLAYDRADMWAQWGPERNLEIWAAHDAKIIAAEARMWADGIDPNDVGKPAHHKGAWPRFLRDKPTAPVRGGVR